MKKLLLIVDPQMDFIIGSLPVPGAVEAMDSLAAYISKRDGKYIHKIITADSHPYDHCSFEECGGKWPRHCVHDTLGAAIWPGVFDAAYRTSGDVTLLHKGEYRLTEEYSIFKNPDASRRIDNIIRENHIERIDICGLAGDVCVRDTLRDGIALYGEGMFKLLEEYSPCIN
ncbi:MAG: isochorismatase family protein [Lachnoclostridium sp.]|nr:isochorismatase family protein [Lachnoclostridium sp.]